MTFKVRRFFVAVLLPHEISRDGFYTPIHGTVPATRYGFIIIKPFRVVKLRLRNDDEDAPTTSSPPHIRALRIDYLQRNNHGDVKRKWYLPLPQAWDDQRATAVAEAFAKQMGARDVTTASMTFLHGLERFAHTLHAVV